MKVILNQDVKYLGEEGDVKNVANGYMRNYLAPRNLAVPYNDATVAYFESRKAEIEARKELKRKESASLKEKLEQLTLVAEMPAGANGKLYGAVTSLTVADLLLKSGHEVERKRIEVPGSTIKNVGNYKVTVKLYESQTATIELQVKAQLDESAKAELAAKEAAKASKVAKEAKEEVPAEESKAE